MSLDNGSLTYYIGGNMGFDFNAWYEDNAERWNNARRSRYENDPEYRERVLAQNRASRDKRKEEDGVDAAAVEKAKKADPGEAWMEFMDDAGQVWLTIGALARALGKSVKTLRLWETKGWIPEAVQRTPKGERLYTPEQVLSIREKLLGEGKVGQSGLQTKTKSYVKQVRVGEDVRAVVLFRVSALAQAAGRSTSIILQHEAKGRFPITPLRAKGGQRLYTAEMIEHAVAAYRWLDTQPPPKDWDTFHEKLKKDWDKLGLNEAEVLGPPAKAC
jgi:DNA-binding transcriptional MerR regulator